jgi:hypothetical protein
MDERMFAVYIVLLGACDYTTGVWMGCASRLAALMGNRWKVRVYQRILNDLKRAKYITSHCKPSPGATFYRIEINNYVPITGPQKGQKLRKVEAGFKKGASNETQGVRLKTTSVRPKARLMGRGVRLKTTNNQDSYSRVKPYQEGNSLEIFKESSKESGHERLLRLAREERDRHFE